MAPPIPDLVSPSGRYHIKSERIDHGEGRWSTIESKVYDYCHDLIAITTRNYSSTFFLFVENHAGSDWLLVSENYHGGMGAIDLQTGMKYIYDPTNVPWYLGGKLGRKVGRWMRNRGYLVTRFLEKRNKKLATLWDHYLWRAIARLGSSEYWCWGYNPTWIPETQSIEVEGCYWAGPHDINTYDFSNPRKLPYKVTATRDAEPEEEEDQDEP